MKAFKFIATILLVVALCTGISSCGGDEDLEQLPMDSVEIENSFWTNLGIKPDDFEHLNHFLTKDSVLLVAGLLNEHIWMGVYNPVTYKKLYEFKDEEVTKKETNMHIGYGEYANVALANISPMGIAPTENGFIAQMILHYGSIRQRVTFFKSDKLKKVTSIIDNNSPECQYLIKWHKETAIIGAENDWFCCKDNGDTLYVAKNGFRPDIGNYIATSYTDGIAIFGLNLSRTNYYPTGDIIWVTNVQPPFDVPENAKCTTVVLDSSSNKWKCKANLVFYDGTKKEHIFTINIDNGKLIGEDGKEEEEDIKVTGISLNETKIELDINETFQLIASILPENATNKNLIWSTSNEAVASVRGDGLVTAKSTGEANITATTADGGFSVTATVTVKKKQDDYASLIVGKWKKTTGDAVATHVTYKNDGTFEYTSTEETDYKEVGKWKIEGNKLYELFSDEEEYLISEIILLNSMTLTVKELEDDGVTPSNKIYSYQREGEYYDDEETNASLVGSWIYSNPAGNMEVLTFNADKTGSCKSIDIYDNTSNTDAFTYTLNEKEGKLIIDFGDGDPETYSYTISGNKLTLIEDGGRTEVYVKL